MTDYRKEKYWSRFAGSYNREQAYVVGENVLQAIMERISGEGDLGELVEFGCGAGFFTRELAKNASRITATDLSDEMLALARTQLKEEKNVVVGFTFELERV